MRENDSDYPLDKETGRAAAGSPGDVVLCRYQELADEEYRFRAGQKLERGGGIEPSAKSASEKDINRYVCQGGDGSSVTVVEYQHNLEINEHGRQRTYPGARRLALISGEAVRRVAEGTFEVIASGE